MIAVLCLLAFASQTTAATIYPPNQVETASELCDLSKSCNKNITLVDQFVQPSFNLAANFQCKYHFSVPSGSYANIQLQASNTQYTDTIYISGDNQVHGISMNCAPERVCTNYSVSTVYPGNFGILIGTVWEPHVSGPQVSINSALDRYDSYQRDIELNKIFVFIDNSTPVTMNDMFPTATRITLYLAKKLHIKGAVFITDLSNLDGIYDHKVQYVPLNGSSGTDYAPLFSNGFYNPPWWGGATIIGEKDGSTPIDIRQFNTFGGSGSFYYAPGGPIANHTNAIPFGNKQLPMHLTGNVNTLYIDQQQGNVKYTISV